MNPVATQTGWAASSERWAVSDQNDGRFEIGMGGRNALESAPRAGGDPLLGTVDVLIEGALRVHNVAVTRMGNQLWCPLPARPVINGSNHIVRDNLYQPVWEPVLSWSTPAEHSAFSASVIDALRSQYPRALPRNCQFVPKRDDARPAHP